MSIILAARGNKVNQPPYRFLDNVTTDVIHYENKKVSIGVCTGRESRKLTV